ncbi:MAG TPA: hypothetical protein VF621_03345 [Pyrinomonadaceae bacterium]|jgi:hypothetical protein
MPERKDMAGKDDEPQVRGRKGPSTQARSERKRRPAGKRDAKGSSGVPKVGKHEHAGGGGDDSGGGLH